MTRGRGERCRWICDADPGTTQQLLATLLGQGAVCSLQGEQQVSMQCVADGRLADCPIPPPQ